MKKIAFALLLAAMLSLTACIEYRPVANEGKGAAEAAETVILEDVYWANSLGGKVYHTHDDCSSINRYEELIVGSVAQAYKAGRTRLCYYCARKDGLEFLLEGPVDIEKVMAYLAQREAQNDAEKTADTAAQYAGETGELVSGE